MSESTLQLVPKPAASLTLYEVEDDLLALLDSEALVTPEQKTQFEVELALALLAARSKRDRVASFIKSCDTAAKFAGEEIKRLRDRKQVFENASERLREYVTRVIREMGEDAKGKLHKLEGDHFTMYAQACPVSADISDEASIPGKYKNITVTMAMNEWAQLMLTAEQQIPGWTKRFDGSDAPLVSIDKQAIKRDLEAGQEIPGADLIVDKLSLRIK